MHLAVTLHLLSYFYFINWNIFPIGHSRTIPWAVPGEGGSCGCACAVGALQQLWEGIGNAGEGVLLLQPSFHSAQPCAATTITVIHAPADRVSLEILRVLLPASATSARAPGASLAWASSSSSSSWVPSREQSSSLLSPLWGWHPLVAGGRFGGARQVHAAFPTPLPPSLPSQRRPTSASLGRREGGREGQTEGQPGGADKHWHFVAFPLGAPCVPGAEAPALPSPPGGVFSTSPPPCLALLVSLALYSRCDHSEKN